jgi:hypothetical protein
MLFWRIPFSRWPLRFHVRAASSLLLAGFAACGWFVHQAQVSQVARTEELHTLEAKLAALRQAKPVPEQRPFTQDLPAATLGDEVVHNLTRFAQEHGVVIASLAIERQAATSSDLGLVRFDIKAKADYGTAKAWIADALGRYPSLGLQTLTLQPSATEPSRQEVHMVLALYVRD